MDDQKKSNDLLNKLRIMLEKFNEGELLAIIVASFLVISIANILMIKKTSSELIFVTDVNLLTTVLNLLMIIICFVLLRQRYVGKNFTFNFLLLATFIFGILIIRENTKNIYLTLGILTIVGFIVFAVFKNREEVLLNFKIEMKMAFFVVVVLFIIVSAILAIATIYRHKTFNSAIYDLGIFTQMFESLKATGLPITTVERNLVLSHFAIHFSPIYYLILPGYFIFSSPEYLLIVQAIMICSAVFPVFLICKHYKFNGFTTLLISSTYLFFPGVVTPAFYDFHENKFLTVLILWMIYFLEKNKLVPMCISMMLVLFVKEDAALYMMILGLFCIFAQNKYKQGIIIFTSALLYFVVTITLMNQFGYGIMDSRFNVYQLSNESGLFPVMKNIFLDPAFFVKSLFSEEKFMFIAYMMTPLLFIPLITKKTQRLILVIPMVVINLMTTYKYQFNIGYQYTYGVSAFLFYLFIININDVSIKLRKIVCILAVFSSIALMLTSTNNKLTKYYKSYIEDKQTFVQSEIELAKIPSGASVTSEVYFVSHLSRFEKLYVFPSENKTEYVVLDIRCKNDFIDKKECLLNDGEYELISSGGYVLVYKKNDGIVK